MRLEESDYEPESGAGLQHPPYTTRPTLVDGGVYDNLGLETAWKEYKTVLVSDGGGATPPQTGALGVLKGWRWRDWGTQAERVLHVIDSQVRSLRKRAVIEGFAAPAGDVAHREGCYWGIRTDIENYNLPSSLPCPVDATIELANVHTRLAALDENTQHRLINWGYAVCDTAMRRWVDTSLAEGAFPFPEAGVGAPP